jgi:pyruvate dehydrogenase E1 component alpha subunit
MPRKEIERFTVSSLQILDEKGHADPELDPGLSEEELLRIYRGMVLARQFDLRLLNLQRQGRIGTVGPSAGQEAANVVPAFALGDQDWYIGAYRELGAHLVRGEPLENQLLFYNGFEEGNFIPAGTSPASDRMLPISIIVSAQTLHAVGVAYAMKYRGESGAVLTYTGDGGSSQGDFYEAMNFAGVWQAPVVFIIQNNQWAISMPREKQTRAATLAQKAIAAGIEGIQVDGNDALGMYVATRDALARARAGEGPTLIEAVTYRLGVHTTADDPRKYRGEEDEAPWREKEPLPRFRNYLEKKKIWDAKREEALLAEIKEQIDAAVANFESRSDMPPEVLFDHVFGTRHAEIDAQRAEFLEQLKLDQDSES